MHWYARPPYVRWTAAVLLVSFAIWLDIRPNPTVEHPFAAETIPAGTNLATADVEWRRVPRGVLPETALNGITVVAVPKGQPILSAMIGSPYSPGVGWWTVEVAVPAGGRPGQAARIVLFSQDGTSQTIPAVVVQPPPDNPGGMGLVAVPEEAIAEVAAAIAQRSFTVLLTAG